MIQSPERTKVVIIGGGFAGIEVARSLAKSGLPLDLTLVSKSMCFQYYPSLYRLVVGATVNQVSIPLEKALPQNVTVIADAYVSLDQAARTIVLHSGKELHYDYLVMALGSEPNYFGIDGMEAQSMSFLSIDRARALRQHFADQLEKSKSLDIEDSKMELHTIIVGAGPSGTELAGALKPYLVREARKAGVDPALIAVDLLDSSSRVLASIPARASMLVARQLQKRGVNVLTNHGVNSCSDRCLVVADKNVFADVTPEEKHLRAGTIIWTAGTKINAQYQDIPGVVLTDKKRVTVTETLTLPADDRIYIVGDGSGTPYSGLAQTAIDQGRYAGNAIAMRIKHVPVFPYEPKQGIFVIPVGMGWAIFSYKDYVFSGLAAWLLRILVDAEYFLTITSPAYVFSMLKKNPDEK